MRNDPRHNPEDHEEDSETDKDGVDGYQGIIALGRDATHLRGGILGSCSTSATGSGPDQEEAWHTEGLLDRAVRRDACRNHIVELGIGAHAVGVGQGASRLCDPTQEAVPLVWCVSSPSLAVASTTARTAQSGSAAIPSSTEMVPAAAAATWQRARRHRPMTAPVGVKDRMFRSPFAVESISLVRQAGR